MIEQIRAWLVREVREPFRVSPTRMQYWCSDDYAFFTEIDVQHPVDNFVLGIIGARSDASANEFLLRALHHAFPEVWLVDREAHYVIQSRRGRAPERLGAGALLASAQLPSIRIPLALVGCR